MQILKFISKNTSISFNPYALGFLLLIIFSNSYAQNSTDSTQLVIPLELDSISQSNISSGVKVVNVVPETSANLVWGKVHKALGLSAVLFGGLTGILNPGNGPENLHKGLGISTAALAVLTMGSGYLAHSGEVSPKKKFSYKHVHALVGMAGSYMLIAAPFVAPKNAHKVLGIGGTVALGASVLVAFAF